MDDLHAALCLKISMLNVGGVMRGLVPSFAIFPVYRLVKITCDGSVRFVTFPPLMLSCYLIIDATDFVVVSTRKYGGGRERELGVVKKKSFPGKKTPGKWLKDPVA